jgi:hypothetical protein
LGDRHREAAADTLDRRLNGTRHLRDGVIHGLSDVFDGSQECCHIFGIDVLRGNAVCLSQKRRSFSSSQKNLGEYRFEYRSKNRESSNRFDECRGGS